MIHYYVDIDTPERLSDIGSVASPADLAYPLANALILIEKRDSARPPFKVRAEEDGNTRDLTEAEQDAFDAALQQALDELERARREAG